MKLTDSAQYAPVDDRVRDSRERRVGLGGGSPADYNSSEREEFHLHAKRENSKVSSGRREKLRKRRDSKAKERSFGRHPREEIPQEDYVSPNCRTPSATVSVTPPPVSVRPALRGVFEGSLTRWQQSSPDSSNSDNLNANERGSRHFIVSSPPFTQADETTYKFVNTDFERDSLNSKSSHGDDRQADPESVDDMPTVPQLLQATSQLIQQQSKRGSDRSVASSQHKRSTESPQLGVITTGKVKQSPRSAANSGKRRTKHTRVRRDSLTPPTPDEAPASQTKKLKKKVREDSPLSSPASTATRKYSPANQSRSSAKKKPRQASSGRSPQPTPVKDHSPVASPKNAQRKPIEKNPEKPSPRRAEKMATVAAAAPPPAAVNKLPAAHNCSDRDPSIYNRKS